MLKDVQHGAGDAPAAQRFDERVFLHDRAAADVDEPGGALHQSQPLPIEKMLRFGGKGAADHDKIAGRQQIVQARRLGLRRQAVQPPLGAEHAHAEALPADSRQPPADFAYADDAQRHRRDLVRRGALQPGGVPRPGVKRLGDGEDIACEHQHRQHAVLGHRLRVAARHVGHHHAPRGSLGDRHQIGAGAVHDHGPQAGRDGDDVVGKLAAGDDALGIAGEAPQGQRVSVRRADDFGAARENVLALRGNGIGQQDAVHRFSPP